MPRPIMCGVPAIARATSCAEITASSNSIVAYLPLKSTLTDFTPSVRLIDPSRVVAQAPQCIPVTMYVALVTTVLSGGFFDSCAWPMAANAMNPTAAKPRNDFILHPQLTQACKDRGRRPVRRFLGHGLTTAEDNRRCPQSR